MINFFQFLIFCLQFINPWLLELPNRTLISSADQFSEQAAGIWKNTSISLHLSQFYGEESLLDNLLQLYNNEHFRLFRRIVGCKNAIDVLELDQRSTKLLYNYYNVTEHSELSDTNRELSYSILSEDTSTSCKDAINLSDWMRCYIDTISLPLTKYSCALVEYIYGISTSPELYKQAWTLTDSNRLKAAPGVAEIGKIFKSNDAQYDCTSSFLAVDNNFDIWSPGGNENPFFLLGIIPRTRSGNKCKTATLENDITDMASISLAKAMEKHMVSFCITFTGQNGWFGSHDWFGQVKVLPVFRVRGVNYSQIPCFNVTGNALFSLGSN